MTRTWRVGLIHSALCLSTWLTCAKAEVTVFVENGKAKCVHAPGKSWQTKNGVLEGVGKACLRAGRGVGMGDFRITARLRMLNQKRSAAAFAIAGGHFGFEGAKAEEIFMTGGLVRAYKNLGPAGKYFKRGEWLNFEVVRRGGRIKFIINGKVVHSIEGHPEALGGIGLTPWRSTMQIREFRMEGNTIDVPEPKPRGYTIPLIDLAGEKHRQVVVDREPGQYLGHPTTVLLEDNRTIITVYPKGHGRGAIVMKRSTDTGLTWSERLPVPDNWSTSKEVPTIHRVIDPKGVKRLIMFSGLYPIRMAVSQDDGKNWTPLEPIGDFGGIVTMGCVVRLDNGDYMACFHDDGRFLHDKGKRTKFQVFKTISKDGGLTWSGPIVIAEHPTAHLCEPGIVRSPDGKQFAMLLRENSRTLNSFVTFSNDQGETWTKPVQLPGALTGDRHTGRYAPDGRLFITFRDTTHESPTKGDWVGWVGTYEDIVKGRQGQYRVRLMDNHKGGDCAYPGLELLPDGTFVTTTYGHWVKGKGEGKKPFIVSVRFKINELDAKAAKLRK